jgi:oligopeptide/dipeptide ABC transporter ATP-binding protein
VLLEVKGLKTVFEMDKGTVKAVDGVDLQIREGGIYGLVGESGCGKSMTLLSLLRLVPRPGKISAGEILLNGEDILKKSKREVVEMRGRDLAMIFQDPMTTLNPVYRVGEQIRESLRTHNIIASENSFSFRAARKRLSKERQRVLELMDEVGIPSPTDRYSNYPHQFSGGLQQRSLIAVALSCAPKILLADEPTTALDVTIQAQVLNLMRKINHDRGMAIILVTHDLGVAAEFCHEISVMYAGKIVEKALTDDVIENPKHPYTQGLLNSIPRITGKRERLQPIMGSVPNLLYLPPGCAFQNRCAHAFAECNEPQPMIETNVGHFVRCSLYRDHGGRDA